MANHHALPHFHPLRALSAPRQGASAAHAARVQRIKDLLTVAAVLALVLATAAVIVSYVARELPGWRAGQFSSLAQPAVVAAQPDAVANNDAAASVVNGLGRLPLILISTAIELAIFVALGLYLRHDMNRKA